PRLVHGRSSHVLLPALSVNTPEQLVEKLAQSQRIAVARGITWAENLDPRFARVLGLVHDKIGRAWRTGVTGPPGAGKSTLTNELIRALRAEEKLVSVLAVDPSSPFTGGALLGDRIRMEERTVDPGVFIRSMASRDSHGGLARASVDACDVMDAFGFDEILLETVGVGQAEYDVVSACDTTLVVLCPGAGDGVQAMKSGLLEVADVIAVNKSDLPGAERLGNDLEEAIHIRLAGKDRWQTPVVHCSAGREEGIGDVLAAIRKHREWLDAGPKAEKRAKARVEQVKRVVFEHLHRVVWKENGFEERVRSWLDRGTAPYDVADHILADLSSGLAPAALDSPKGANC
ncbi:MAG: methylmalonyl Co-A mutase-associated GTPase MeaB, partial [Planctomycetota bacterium]